MNREIFVFGGHPSFRYVSAKILLGDLKVGSIALHSSHRFVHSLYQPVIPFQEDCSTMRAFGNLIHLLDLDIRFLLLQVEVGQAVIDGSIDPAGGQQINRLIEALGRYDLGTVVCGDFAEVAGERLAGFLPLRSAKVLIS